MNGMENFLREKIRSQGTHNYKKFLATELIRDWKEIVDESIAEHVTPVTIEHSVLFVSVENSAFKDQLKFFTEEILDAINERFNEGEPLVKEIRIAKSFQIAEKPPEKIPPAQIKNSVTIEEITLTDEEIARCREKAQEIDDEKLRETVYETLISYARSQKFRLANGWHKCKNCAALCEPEEIFCTTCKIKERTLMVEELFKIFYDEPWLKPWDAQKILLDRMPYMKRECELDVVESARTSLIQKIASKVRSGDEKSSDVLKLVALEKRLHPEKITPAIIRRTLIDMQFNLADQAQLRRYNAIIKPREK